MEMQEGCDDSWRPIIFSPTTLETQASTKIIVQTAWAQLWLLKANVCSSKKFQQNNAVMCWPTLPSRG